MKRNERFHLAAAVMAVVSLPLLLLLAACGSDTATSTSPNSPSAGASESATPLPSPKVAGTIAFANEVTPGKGGNGDIYVVNSDGTGLRQLTDTPGRETGPSWSPDGSRIVYTAFPVGIDYPAAKGTDLWVMNADGSGKTKLTTGSVKGEGPVWSPDGKQIAFTKNGPGATGSGALYVVNADGGGLRRVTRPDSDAPAAASLPWAQDDMGFFLQAGDVWSVNPDGGSPVQLTKAGNVAAFAVSPDGKQIAIDNISDDIVEVIPTRGGSSRVTLLQPVSELLSPDPYAAPAWTSDGRALAVASRYVDTGVHGSLLFVVNADGSGLSAVPGVAAASDPAWRPD